MAIRCFEVEMVLSNGNSFFRDEETPSWWRRLKTKLKDENLKVTKIRVNINGFVKEYVCKKYIYFMNKFTKGNGCVVGSVVHDGENAKLLYYNPRAIENPTEMPSFKFATGINPSKMKGIEFSQSYLREKNFQIKETDIGLIEQG